MDAATLHEHGQTAELYANRAERNGLFLGHSAEFWRGAAAAYALIASVLERDKEADHGRS